MIKQKLKIGYPYYLADGTVVYLNALTTDGQAVVREFYEGKTLAAELLPSGHSEFDVPFEVDGRILIVEQDQLFPKPPVAKKIKEIEELDNRIKELSATQKEIAWENDKAIAMHEAKIAALKDRISELETLAAGAQKRLDDVEDECSNKIDKITKVALSADYEIDAKGNVVISATDYLNLLRNDYTMNAYETAGVDNWDGYNFAFENYEENAGCTIDETIVSIAYQIAAKGGALPDDFFRAGA